MEKCGGEVLYGSVVAWCGEVVWRSVVEKRCGEGVLWRSVALKCCREAL